MGKRFTGIPGGLGKAMLNRLGGRFILGFFVLMLLGAASAVQISGDSTLELDCSTPARAAYVLHNDSGQGQTYTIRATGENKDWVNLNGKWVGQEPLVVTLEEDESVELYAFIKPQACYVRPGKYTVVLEVSNDDTITKRIEVEVMETRLLALEVSGDGEIPQCGKAEFEVSVENLGGSSERATISVEGIPQGWVALSFTELFLGSGATKSVALEIAPDCGAKARTYDFRVKAALNGTSFVAEENASMTIEDSQQVEISSGVLEACTEGETTRKIEITNNGRLSDGLAISIEGLDWARAIEENIALEPGETREIEIVLGGGKAVGNYEFVLNAHSTKFNKDNRQAIIFAVLDCYSLGVETVGAPGLEEGAKAVACLESRPVYSFGVSNPGPEKVEAEVRVIGLDAAVEPASIALESGETAELKVELDFSKEKEGKKVFTLQIKGNNVSLERDFEVEAQDCYNLAVEWDGLEKEIELDANCKSEPYTVLVENKGTREQSFSVSVSGPEWVYFEPMQASVGPGETREVYFFFAPPYDTKEGKQEATASIKGSEGEQSRKIEAIVSGGLYADLGTASVKADVQVEEVIERTEKTVKVLLQLSNDSNAMIRVYGISAKDNNAEFEFRETLLQPEESVEVPMELALGFDNQETLFSVPLQIETDKGTMEKTIEVNLGKKEEQDAMVGLFGVENASDWLLAILVVAIIAVFAAAAIHSELQARKPKSGLTNLAEEVAEIPGKRLEEIGRRGKAKPSGRNLQDIVKEVKKKQPAKGKTGKKKK